MAYLSPIELARVALVRPDVLSPILKTMADFQELTGRKTFVPEKGGVRSAAAQQETYADSLANGFRASPPGHSKHEYGAAVDLQIVGIDQNAAVDARNPLYEQLAQCAEANGLKAGIRFPVKKPADADPYHFESPDSIVVCQAKWATLTKERLWRAAILIALAGVVAVIFHRGS